ncbi:pyrroline-5-carboxylate reductase [Membranihabitans maritimus]|uniref:pyrroline-5-carboxylate reductase n=1 Tax=Membranihabitans maritimus TaxID=2904244 RepID=UPI001F016547|nr:pyrroline-5-carboxylate reductase [Membranihabitans maritimus]
MKVLVIGAGNMGLTYATGIAESKTVKQEDLMIMDAAPDKIESLKKLDYFDVYDKIEDCIEKADIVLIAVKPYHAKDLFASIKDRVRDDQIFVSLMAGVTIKTIQDLLGISKVVRTMPNLPAQVGKGLTSFTGSDKVSKVELESVKKLLDTTGISLAVKNEKFIDASTGISGSGPAYVFYFMQGMIDAALNMGFSSEEAKLLVKQTFEGATELYSKFDLSPEEWMDRVASKGGTTRAALDSLESNNVGKFIKEAAFAAYNRAEELGK